MINFNEAIKAAVKDMRASGLLYDEVLRQFKREYLQQTLTDNKGNLCHAARDLGRHRNTLNREVAESGLREWLRELRQGRKYPAREMPRGIRSARFRDSVEPLVRRKKPPSPMNDPSWSPPWAKKEA